MSLADEAAAVLRLLQPPGGHQPPYGTLQKYILSLLICLLENNKAAKIGFWKDFKGFDILTSINVFAKAFVETQLCPPTEKAFPEAKYCR